MRRSLKKKPAARLLVHCVIVVALPAFADESKTTSSPPGTSDRTVRDAAARSIRLIEQSATEILKHRQCSTCHHQTLSLIVFDEARRVGLEFDEGVFQSQLRRIRTYHASRLEGYLAAKDNGEQVHTPGYGLWGLDAAGHQPDKLTAAIVGYLLSYQQESGHWLVGLDRRPAEASDFTTNYLAIRAVKRYGIEHQRDQIATRTKAVKQWLAKAKTRDTEDEVFRLRLAHELNYEKKQLKPFIDGLLDAQHISGGWPQTAAMAPDAYATASVLVALHESGNVPVDHPSWQLGLRYLLQTQQPDGSWHVVTRAKPMQEYFESGFPYRGDQFISAFATGWSTKALLLSLRVTEQGRKPG